MQSAIESNLQSLQFFGTELIVLATLVVLLVVSLITPDDKKRLNTSLLTFLGLSAAAFRLMSVGIQPPNQGIFHGLLAADPLSIIFKAIFLLATIIVVLMTYDSPEISDNSIPEFYVFLLAIFIGMSLLGSGLHLLILYLGLEIVSLPSYVLAGYYKRQRASSEAGIKYLLYGAVAGGTFIYGASLLYGITGAFTLSGIAGQLATTNNVFGIVVALTMILLGIGYKCSFFPMHMWVPDVYQGAPTAVGGFLSTAPKAAGFAVLIRMSMHFVPALAENPEFTVNLPVFFFLLSAVTMTIGNLSAIFQNNLKRLLGYSTIAHVGYMMMAYSLVGTETQFMREGFTAISFYLIIYTLMNLGAFLVVIALDREWMDEFDGMIKRAPLAAVAMAIFLFSLTGLPPLAGFVGKFYLFSTLIQTQQTLYISLAIIGVLNSVVSLFYYARVLKHMFLTEPDNESPIQIPRVSAALLTILSFLVVGLGIYWSSLIRFTKSYFVLTGLQ
jgi:NADH-quinone oxidoreductase subunit N